MSNPPRKSTVERNTQETQITIKVNLDGTGKFSNQTPYPFLSHMLDLLSKHSLINLEIKATGDSVHHLTEDVAITLGTALDKALGDRKGIARYGHAVIPMDETLVRATLDLGGRPYVKYYAYFSSHEVEGWPVELVSHFFDSISQNLRANIHIELQYGANDHHKVEAIFKAFARALRQATQIDAQQSRVPSSKGVI